MYCPLKKILVDVIIIPHMEMLSMDNRDTTHKVSSHDHGWWNPKGCDTTFSPYDYIHMSNGVTTYNLITIGAVTMCCNIIIILWACLYD